MVRRRGLGATMVAAVAFSVILLAGVSVYVAALGRANLYSTADAEDALNDGFRAMEAAEGYNVMLAVQGALTSGPIACATASSVVQQAVAGAEDNQSGSGLVVTSRAALVQSASSADNLSSLRPFAGSVSGELDLSIRYQGSGSSPPGVTFSRTETHLLHLGVRLGPAASDCLRAVSAIEGALSKTENCTMQAIGPVIEGAATGPRSDSASDGFQLQLTYAVASGASCTVTFQVVVEQAGVEGPGGSFSVRFEESGAVRVATPSP